MLIEYQTFAGNGNFFHSLYNLSDTFLTMVNIHRILRILVVWKEDSLDMSCCVIRQQSDS